MSRTTILLGSLLTLTLAACSETTAPIAAPEAPSLAILPAVCATVTLPVTSVTVVNKVMPSMRYTVKNCGSTRLTLVVRPYEAFGQMSDMCPAPVATPVRVTLSAGRSSSGSFRTYRGSCGFVSPLVQQVTTAANAWQSHRLMIEVRNAATNAQLSFSNSAYTWQDAF